MSGTALAALTGADRSSDLDATERFPSASRLTACVVLLRLVSLSELLAVCVGTAAVQRWRRVAGLGVPWTSWRGVGRLRAFAPHPEGALRPRLVPSWGVARPVAFAPRIE